MARGCARVGTRGLVHESRICADARGSPARLRVADLRGCTRFTSYGHESRICADRCGSPARSRREFAPIDADHLLGYESRICADAHGSLARSRVADPHAWARITGSVTSCGLRRSTRITASVTSCGFAPIGADHQLGHESRIRADATRITGSVTSRGFARMHADHRLGYELRICADARGSPARSRVADLRRCTRITRLVTRRGFAPMVADHRLGHESRIRADCYRRLRVPE